MKKQEFSFWLAPFDGLEGCANLYCERNGEDYEQCVIQEGREYSVKELAEMLGLENTPKGLNQIAREIYEHNAYLFERIKANVRHACGQSEADKMGKYPDFKHRLHNR